jgi:hypothetical protein
MKLIRILLIMLLASSCQKSASRQSASDIVPEYNMLVNFSRNIDPDLKLRLYSYGINNNVPKEISAVGITHDFSAAYWCFRDKEDEVSVEEARRLLISITEALRKTIDADERFQDRLYIRPFLASFLDVSVHFVDSMKEDLKRGVTDVSLWRGKVRYKKEKIGEYNICYHGSLDKIEEISSMQLFKYQELPQESYEEALEFVQSHGGLLAL